MPPMIFPHGFRHKLFLDQSKASRVVHFTIEFALFHIFYLCLLTDCGFCSAEYKLKSAFWTGFFFFCFVKLSP